MFANVSFLCAVHLCVCVFFFLWFTLNDDVFVLNQPKCQLERKTFKLVSPEERREQASGIITC